MPFGEHKFQVFVLLAKSGRVVKSLKALRAIKSMCGDKLESRF
jgi:hypothetical protein